MKKSVSLAGPESRPRTRYSGPGMTRVWSTIMSSVLKSPAFDPGAVIPKRHTGDGEDLSPPLAWSGLPPDTRELALIVDDPDAPSPQPWVHWVISKIPAADPGIAEGVHPKPAPSFPSGAIQGKNSWGTIGYRGPAPPKGHGVHRYHFRLYALDAPLSVAAGIDKPGLLKAMQGHNSCLTPGRIVGPTRVMARPSGLWPCRPCGGRCRTSHGCWDAAMRSSRQ